MGPGSILIEVCSKTGASYFRGDRQWAPDWSEYLVDDELLAVIEADPHLNVRAIDPHRQAARKRELALAAIEAADKAESLAKMLRVHANTLVESAAAAEKKAGKAPEPAPQARPMLEAMLSVLPEKTRNSVVEDIKKQGK